MILEVKRIILKRQGVNFVTSQKEIAGIGIIPILKFEDKEIALKTVQILKRQALPMIEIEIRSSSALEIVRYIKSEVPQMMIGVSNVFTVDQIDELLDSGADYVSTVHVNAALVEKCRELGVLIVPECPTAVDIEKAKNLGCQCVKLLSSSPLSEIKIVKELTERYKGMNFMISGGIEPSLFVDYLNIPSVVGCGLGQYSKDNYVENNEFDKIEANVEQLVRNLLGLELAHIGVNSSDDEAGSLANEFGQLLKDEVKETPISFFAGNTVEVMKNGGRGKNGHIGYRVNNVARAMCYFISKGYHFVPETFKKNEEGEIFFAYFEEEIGGFAIHIAKK